MRKNTAIKILIGITAAALIFHALILLKIIPYDVTWGGRLKTDQEMYVFEAFSILVNAFFVYILLQKGHFVSPVFSEKTLSYILWVFFAIFVLNTVGNVVAKTTFEKTFALITLINAVLLWQINKSSSVNIKREN
jgi:membrane protease YdiL (CAAX protease family)